MPTSFPSPVHSAAPMVSQAKRERRTSSFCNRPLFNKLTSIANSGHTCCGPVKASTDSLTWQTSTPVGSVEEEVSTQDSPSNPLAVRSGILDLYMSFGRKEHNLK